MNDDLLHSDLSDSPVRGDFTSSGALAHSGGVAAGEHGVAVGRDARDIHVHHHYYAGVTSSTAQVGDGLQALNELARSSDAVRAAIGAFRAEFEEASRLIDVLADYKDLHDLLHQLEFECYELLAGAAPRFPDEADNSLIKYQVKLEDVVDQLGKVVERGAVARQDAAWIVRLTSLPEELDRALNTLDKKLLETVLRRLKQTLDIQPSQINMRLNSTARTLRLPLLARALAQVRDHLPAHADLNLDKVHQFQAGVDALVNLSLALEKLIEDHDGWQGVEALLNRVEDMLEFDTQELELAWPDLKSMAAPLCAGRADKPAFSFVKEALTLDEALASANPDRIRKSFLSYRARAGYLFYRLDVDLKRLCSELRKVGEPLASVLRLTE